MLTTVTLSIPTSKKDDWTIYDRRADGLVVDVPRSKFSITTSEKGGLTYYTLTANDIFNHISIGVETEFEEVFVSRGYLDLWKVNMADCYPDMVVFKNNNFGDLSNYMWASKEIKIAKIRGIVDGYPDGKFHSGDNVTRAQFIKMVIEAADAYTGWGDDFYLAREQANIFPDLKNHWGAIYCGLAMRYGWVKPGNGSGGYFLPDQAITREEAAYILWNVFSSPKAYGVKRLIRNDSSNASYVDMNSIKEEYRNAVSQLSLNGIMSGYFLSGTYYQFRPKLNLTRAEACKMIINGLY